MCDPVSLAVGALGGMAVSSMNKPRGASAAAAQPDPAAEQAAAEAKAAQAANAKLAADQQRRRQQQSLIAKGAPVTTGPTLGDVGDSTASPLSPGGMNRSTAARRTSSLLARGATASGSAAAPMARAPASRSIDGGYGQSMGA